MPSPAYQPAGLPIIYIILGITRRSRCQGRPAPRRRHSPRRANHICGSREDGARNRHRIPRCSRTRSPLPPAAPSMAFWSSKKVVSASPSSKPSCAQRSEPRNWQTAKLHPGLKTSLIRCSLLGPRILLSWRALRSISRHIHDKEHVLLVIIITSANTARKIPS